jgi:hypothetical protein
VDQPNGQDGERIDLCHRRDGEQRERQPRTIGDESEERHRDERRGPQVVAIEEERAEDERADPEHECRTPHRARARPDPLEHGDARDGRRDGARGHQQLEDQEVVRLR